MAKHNKLGKDGEDIAASYLQKIGYNIIARNWIYNKYEIDIIAQNKDYIVFIEVKTRSSSQWGNPEEAITNNKIRRIVEAADFYLQQHEIDHPAQFDVISIIHNGDIFEIDHIEDAFIAPLN